MAFYKRCKAEIFTRLKSRGYVADRLGEGVTRKIDGERTCVVLSSGLWTYLEVKVGLRFDSINRTLYSIALDSLWDQNEASVFSMKQTALFFKKVGDFCENETDVGGYCPTGSRVADVEEVIESVLNTVAVLEAILDIYSAIDYYKNNDCFDPYGCMMFGAAAATNDMNIMRWAKSFPQGDLHLFSDLRIKDLIKNCEKKISGNKLPL